MNPHCPLRGVTISTDPLTLQGLEYIRFEADPNGGCGHCFLKCKTCGVDFRMFESMGSYYTEYQWPAACLEVTEKGIAASDKADESHSS